ncbi:MAG: histidine phosphatase family protein [Clostridiales bacterium]|nr:histidine phosphatase family protein [Clostridiales bacterium]MBR6487589.1 histidine phosphatase family protein [Clostridiales bacterium]
MIYILRHGKTEWNKLRKLQGRTDIPLCEEGRVMAREAAEKYAGTHFDVCYCSPLIRAKETAEIILKGRDVPIIFDDRLKEMAFGKYEGIERSFEIPDCPINVLFDHPEEYVAPEDAGESLDELYARTGSFLEEVIKPLHEEGKDVLIVGHGALNSCMLTQAKGLPRKDFWSHGIVQCTLMTLFSDA